MPPFVGPFNLLEQCQWHFKHCIQREFIPNASVRAENVPAQHLPQKHLPAGFLPVDSLPVTYLPVTYLPITPWT
jgi:hypothetical protein